MIEVDVTVECAEAMSTDEAEQRVRDAINADPTLRAVYVSWSSARHPAANALTKEDSP